MPLIGLPGSEDDCSPAVLPAIPKDPQREDFVDVLRGYALVAITINHFALIAEDLGVGHVTTPTLTPFGFSSAAELFVLCSGFAWARSAGRRLARSGFEVVTLLSLRRCALLLLAILGLTLACAAIIRVAIPPDVQARDSFAMAGHVFASPFMTLRQIATLQWTPSYIDVLNLYVVLIAAAPLILAGLARNPRTILVASGLLYLLCTAGFLPLSTQQIGMWSFHPLAWQVLFVLGMAAGHWDWLPRIPPRRVLLAALVASLMACFVVKVVVVRGLGLGPLQIEPIATKGFPLTDKALLEPLRLAHALALATALLLAYRFVPRWVQSRLIRFPGGLGRLSLPTFIVSNVLLYLAAAVLAAAPSQGMFALLTFGLLVALPLTGAAWQRRPWGGKRRTAHPLQPISRTAPSNC